ncbi:RagB/SusD family nutrient uptake outer membrane protein [uncultured Duncaniella sp.]|jgi:SusD family.|uniref:RagB/SusD family nutrient uptake outer membrane protein n=1 Tax=uncultured Duncaniella sp. TaxID=2768039 RepID=UPI0025B1AFA5|nr:RagB/SusD family nutrient uptake outer membrane protein [uncultured Duncaniella sp.]
MKLKIYIGAIILGLATTFSSCLDDLDLKQPSQFTSASMWTEENDVASAVNGAYALMRDAFRNTNDFWGDLRSNLWTSGRVNDATYARTGLNRLEVSWTGSDWADLYKVVNQANLILRHINDLDFDKEESRNEYLAQAYFVRAYCYYYIVRLWGDAPLCLNPFESENQEDMYPSRTSASELYALVESDIENALSLMPVSGKKIHQASPAAVNMLRADFYLWKASRLGGGQDAYRKALDSANAVIAMDFELLDDFASVFSPENKTNKELILTYPFNIGENVTAGTSPNYYAYFLAQTEHTQLLLSNGYSLDYVPVGSHAQYSIPNEDYVTFLLKDSQDQRGSASVRRYEDDFLNNQLVLNVVVLKFAGTWKNNTRSFDCDMPVYRLPEAYIFKAEALNGIGDTDGAMAALNVLEKRARGIDNYYMGLDRDGVTNAIIDEVKMEFVAEGKTWWTYLRNNKEFEQISSLVGRSGETNVTLWPVHQNSLNTNKNIYQTEGYK